MKALVINLDRAPEKFRNMSDRLRAAGVSNIERVPAVDAQTMSDADAAALSTRMCSVLCPREAIAISASHMAAWKRVLEKGVPYAMIFEDDAVLVDEFTQKLHRALASAPPDFDILLLGCFGLCDPGRPRGLVSACAPQFMKNSVSYESERVFAPELFAGTHAYIVSNAGCRKLLERIPKARFHIDWTIASEHAFITIYATNPQLAFQERMDDSDTATCRGFPGSASAVLWNMCDSKGIPWGYYADVRFLRLGTDALVLSPWHIILLLVGAVSRLARVPWGVLATLVVADIAVFRPRDTVSRLLFLGLGWGVAAATI